jgi:hypothetical protein
MLRRKRVMASLILDEEGFDWVHGEPSITA